MSRLSRVGVALSVGLLALVTLIVAPVGVSVASAAFTSCTYVSNFNSDTVSVINSSTNMVVATVNVGNRPQGIAVTPNGSFSYVANAGSGTVSVIKTSTNTVTKTVHVGTDLSRQPLPRTGNTPTWPTTLPAP